MLIHEITEENYITEIKNGAVCVRKKFEKYDKLKEISSQVDLTQQLAAQFEDPTVWAYATLRDKQNNALKLLPYQDKFVNDKNRFVYVTASNQIGKTFGACIKVLHHALHVPNASVMVVSK